MYGIHVRFGIWDASFGAVYSNHSCFTTIWIKGWNSVFCGSSEWRKDDAVGGEMNMNYGDIVRDWREVIGKQSDVFDAIYVNQNMSFLECKFDLSCAKINKAR